MRYFAAALLAIMATPACAADVAGTWALYAMNRGEITDATRLELSVTGNAVTGKGRGFTVSGTLSGDDLTFTAAREDGFAFGTFAFHISGADAAGTLKRPNNTTDQFVLHRLPARATPKTVTFEPKTYHRLFGPAEPALRINAGDTVRTTTLDATGRDAADKTVALAGNPQTGPIYVDGAIAGDTLAVTITRLRLNKPIARSGTLIVNGALTSDYAAGQKADPKLDGEWKLDGNTATLAHPTDRLRDFRLALKPMLGGIGVAPARDEAFRTQQLGYYGGNLDYNGLTEGTTIYLPVAREGGLLYVGDVHAAQGAGELTGDALETSADLELRIDVLPGNAPTMPRAENADYLMSLGVAGSMEAATRLATTGLAQWLQRDYGLSAGEAALVLGTAAQIEVAEIPDPQVNIVAKIAKSALAGIRHNPN